MRRYGWVGLAALVCTAIAIFGCDTKPGSDGKTGVMTVGIVFDTGGLGDKSFNDSAWRGIERAVGELAIRDMRIESGSESEYEDNLILMAEEGIDLVIAVGINMQTALKTVAPQYPNVSFAIIDGSILDLPNVRSLKFKEEEGSYLVGFLAGLMTESGKIGFVGGQALALIRKFEYGYRAGAERARPDVEFLPAKYIGSWDDVDQAKVAANVLYASGADVVYHAAGRAGLGVIRSAAENEKWAIGVDSDQDGVEEGYVLTSMVKGVDKAVFQTIQDFLNGEFTSGEKVYDLASGGVGVSEFRFTRGDIGEDNIKLLEDIKRMIISGEIVVPSTEAEYLAQR
ncbi:MAG: BMP family ABC transporter substrate-binding protein [Armatimonadetes bacterium]|nr:BMP family ABC transporter substrate-binding protein [Armatimonadota bacterium]